jgi:hypothetical protein
MDETGTYLAIGEHEMSLDKVIAITETVDETKTDETTEETSNETAEETATV